MTAGGDGDGVDGMDRWDRHWRHFAESARVNPAQAFRRRLILHLLGGEAAEPGAAILDIGCGSGDLLAELAAHLPGAMFAGIDNSKTGLA
jgi:cyclopropane fatty-acyl-phospholipid synthase-like methyltransferase